MSVKTLKSFLIGIGYDTRGLEAGEKKISSSLQGLKGRALQISGALVGAFSAGAASIAATASSVDRLAASTQNLRTSTNAVYNYGNAIRLMGGEASEALEAITRFEEIQNNLRLKGDAGPVGDLATAGIDVSSLYQTNTGEEFMRALSDMIPRLDEGQRAQVQSALGLSDSTFRALSGGAEQLDNLAKKANGLAGDIDGLADNSRKLRESSAELGLTIEGVRNELADKFLPSLIGASNWLNKLIENNREGISKAIDYAAENDGATAALGLSAGASLAGAAASKIGLTAIGGAAGSAGTLGLATVGGAVGASELSEYLNGKLPGYGQASREFDDWLKDITGLKTIKSPLQLINDVFAPGDSGMGVERSVEDSVPAIDRDAREEDRQANADALAGALSKTPVKVQNNVDMTIQLDGQALESKITQVNERQNYETLSDLATTTER
ncbi:hypothetical protein OO258_26185 [Pseudomonas sp. DCB_BI]|uniref:hypothetical protein n=1 Tax=Pseudomonas sp. DCB_BI TaxID=2993594 RepID=UPI00224B7A35|nr:hypothetical protein [Pseudomonas sp. DCB_BI]MCX2891719.1 hypothetical protein [Pseudomonas sp. DCB_BI]